MIFPGSFELWSPMEAHPSGVETWSRHDGGPSMEAPSRRWELEKKFMPEALVGDPQKAPLIFVYTSSRKSAVTWRETGSNIIMYAHTCTRATHARMPGRAQIFFLFLLL